MMQLRKEVLKKNGKLEVFDEIKDVGINCKVGNCQNYTSD